MSPQSGASYDFTKVDLVIGEGGFRVDAYADAGISIAWQGDQFTVAVGADDINVIVATKSTYAILTSNQMQSSRFLDYVTAWLQDGVSRTLSFQDRSGRTILSDARAVPRQQPNMTFNNSHNARAIDIHCPNLRGTVGGLLDG
jgi:hypothetical protein